MVNLILISGPQSEPVPLLGSRGGGEGRPQEGVLLFSEPRGPTSAGVAVSALCSSHLVAAVAVMHAVRQVPEAFYLCLLNVFPQISFFSLLHTAGNRGLTLQTPAECIQEPEAEGQPGSRRGAGSACGSCLRVLRGLAPALREERRYSGSSGPQLPWAFVMSS